MPNITSRVVLCAALVVTLVVVGLAAPAAAQYDADRSWLPGDHHVHSRRSINYNWDTDPPTPIGATDADYPILLNITKAWEYGVAWMVSTDHGGPRHSEFNLENAYPELLQARELVPEVLLYYGMEFDTPGANHSSLIIPKVPEEDSMLFEIESRFAERDIYPEDPRSDTEERMLEGLRYMRELPDPPLLFVNHPSRSADGLGDYGAVGPHELRNWNETAPEVFVGMEGAPGHQGRIRPDGTVRPDADRGSYDEFHTMGGFDQMTARLGGIWDSLLGEGRRWWVTATSDLHGNWRRGGGDFWPGEYSKTYVYARKSYDDVFDGLRHGRIFVTLGDLITELYVTAHAPKTLPAGIGGTLEAESGSDVEITIRVRDPEAPNHRGETPRLRRVDLIVGEITGPASDPSTDTNPTTRVVRRFSEGDWLREGESLTMTHRLENVDGDHYIRVRGTNTDELEPSEDPLGEDPWSDLWFYSNPIFIEAE